MNTSFTINYYQGKYGPTYFRNYRGLELFEQVIKIIEYILENIAKSQVDI